MKMRLFALSFLLCTFTLFSQDYFPKNDGVKAKNTNYTAFINGKIYVTPSQIVDNGTLLIQNGKVVQVGKSVALPKNTVIVDLKGKYVYPSFIDVFSDFGVEKPKKDSQGRRSADFDPVREGYYWNDHIMPENDATSVFKYDDKSAKTLRDLGFGVVNSHIEDGIARGTGVLIALNGAGTDADRIVSDESAQYFSFEKSVAKNQSYPTSLMGAMALLRQMYYDADWYGKGNVSTIDRSLEALNNHKGLIQIFAAGDNGNVMRADAIGDKFGIQYTILGGGDEYERIADVKATNAKLILPLTFPEPSDVSNPYQANYFSIKDLRQWKQAPSNPRVVAENGVLFAFTMNGLKSTSDFKKNVLKSVANGLSKTKALEALTTVPAQILGKSDQIGSLNIGSLANFLITSGELFDDKTTLFENWVQGTQNIVNDMRLIDIRGDYDLTAGGNQFKVSITGEPGKPKLEIKKDTMALKSNLSYSENWLDITFSSDNGAKNYRMTGLVETAAGPHTGLMVLPDGTEVSYRAIKNAPFEEKDQKEDEPEDGNSTLAVTFPNVGYGNSTLPKTENLLIKNATVWTSEAAGNLENTDVLVKNGKIAKIGQNLSDGSAKVIDAKGKYLTAGIIDEHSHIAALAINEAGQNSSAEVNMEDVVDPTDMDIYRDLAGGVTSIQLLHGSANPIGGRSALLKLKWGESAKNMIYSNAPKFIKFALGENVKQSNWDSHNRFPQSRMGVEQVFIDYFQRAKEYDAKKKSGQPYRYDEEMETLAEVLNGQRFITCHSYVQSEINMMMKVAEKFNFRINTFTHILEGYKVADKMAAHGVGGSTFSDWWAYKFEVNDAIPYNAAIMHDEGVTVAINSDDAEMSRRLNQEAAKTIKYGGMTELEAWKMVTINPAKLLHLDSRVGSIKEGKDADLVLWTDNPLSVAAKAEKTIIEGATYFDLDKDKAQREAVKKERSELINMMMKAKASGGDAKGPSPKKKERFNCDSL